MSIALEGFLFSLLYLYLLNTQQIRAHWYLVPVLYHVRYAKRSPYKVVLVIEMTEILSLF